MADDRLHDLHLDRFWDDLVRGDSGAPAGGLDPAEADAVRAFMRLGAAPIPTRARATKWRAAGSGVDARNRMEHPLHAITVLRQPPAVTGPNGRTDRRPERIPLPPIRPNRAGQAVHWLAAVLLVFGVGGWMLLVSGPGGRDLNPFDGPWGAGDDRLGRIPAPLASPEATPPGGLAEFLWSAGRSPDLAFGTPGYPAVDPRGNVWFTDATHHRFVIYAPDGTYLESWGTGGSGDGEFDFTALGEGYGAVAFDDSGTIYVADTGNARIQTFDPDRGFLATWDSRGNGDGQFLMPWAVAVDEQGRVFVSDGAADTLQVFDGEGRWLATWARSGPGPGEVRRPAQMGLDSQGNLWVADDGNARVQKFSPDGESLLIVDGSGGDEGRFQSPKGLAVDDHDRVFVADCDANRIQVFSPAGDLLGAWGEVGRDDGQLTGAYGLALDGRGNLYVAEDSQSGLQAFRLLPPLAPATTRPP